VTVQYTHTCTTPVQRTAAVQRVYSTHYNFVPVQQNCAPCVCVRVITVVVPG
jgi:hypothetical protein